MMVDTGLKFHAVPLNNLVGHGVQKFMLKFLVKVFKSLYLLKHLIELVDTLSDVRYWSKILHCIFPTFSVILRSRSQTFYYKVFGLNF